MIAALSGGVDSVVLLDTLDALKRDLDFHLAALHVNHHLSPPSSGWAVFCRSVCRARNVPVEIVDVEVAAGASQEAKARARRYDVFRRQDTDFVVLAHSLDDQVETVLLRLLRGAGAHGLAGMRMLRTGLWTQDPGLSKSGPRSQDLGLSGEGLGSLSPQSSVLSPCPRILRPLLDIPRSEILAYARERGLEWMEDESNSDTRFDRNFLRQHVSPLIAERWPAYRQVIARAARNLAESAELLDELAGVDLETCAIDEAIDVARLKRLSRARAANLLRYFLRHRGLVMPDRAWLEEALSQLLDSREDARACIALDEFALRRYHGTIHLVKSAPAYDRDFRVTWRGESELQLPDGILRFSRATGKGISLAHLQASEVTVRFRKGGERFCPDGKRPRRSLKNLLQENAIPPWDREWLPLLFGGDKLVWAAGIGVDAAFQCTPHEEGLVLLWRR